MAYNATVNASNHVSLNETPDTGQSADLDIIHQLGSDTKQIATLGTGWVDNGSHSYTATASSDTLSDLSSSTTSNVKVNYTISNYTAGDLDGNSANGIYDVVSSVESLIATAFSGDVLINSVKEITTTNSYLNYFDVVTKKFVSMSSVGDVGENLVVNGGFDTDTDWILGSGFSIENGIATKINTDSAEIQQLNALPEGRRAIVGFDITSTADGHIRSDALGGPTTVNSPSGRQTLSGTVIGTTLDLDAGYGSARWNGTVDNITAVEILPISTKYTMITSFSSAFTTNVALTQADRDYLDANPESLAETWFETKVHSGLSFVKANMIDMYFTAGGQQSLEKIYNSKDNSFSTIAAYTLACVTNYENIDYGLSKLKLVRDANGTPTGMQADGFTSWEDDGRTAITGWTITAPFTITEETDDDTYTYLSNGNKYKNDSPDGTYTVPTGIWTLDHTRFDGTIGVTKRGNAKMINALQIP